MAADPWAEFKPAEADPWAEFKPAEAGPAAPGRGDLQLAERKREVIANAENVPAHLLTGTPIDQQRAEALWNAGKQSRPLTGRQAAQGMALVGSLVAPPLAASTLGAGAIGGGLTALGTTKAQTIPEAAADTAGGVVGGALGAKALEYGARAFRPLGEWLDKYAIEKGRKVLTGVSSPLARRKELPEEAVRLAYEKGAITPGTTVKTVAERLQDVADPLAERYGAILKEMESQGVTGPHAGELARSFMREAQGSAATSLNSPRPGHFADIAREITGQRELTSGKIPLYHDVISDVPAKTTTEFGSVPARVYHDVTPAPARPAARARTVYRDDGTPIRIDDFGPSAPAPSKLGSEPIQIDQIATSTVPATTNTRLGQMSVSRDAGERVIVPPKPTDTRGFLGLTQAEAMKRSLQRQAASDYLREGTQSLNAEARKDAASMVRQAVEDAVSAQAAKAPEAAAAFQPVKEELHNALTALGPAREAAARMARRSDFGLHEAMGLAAGMASGNPAEAIGSAALMSGIKNRYSSAVGAPAYRIGKYLISADAPPVAMSRAVTAEGSSQIAQLAAALRHRLAVQSMAPAPADQDPHNGGVR